MHASDDAASGASTLQSHTNVGTCLCGNGNQQPTGSLRIEEQIAIFLRHAGSKLCAFANKFPVIFQATGQMAFACVVERTGKIRKRRMLDLKGNGRGARCGISECHFPRVA